MVDLVRFDML